VALGGAQIGSIGALINNGGTMGSGPIVAHLKKPQFA
jgi:hypothetical protein